MPKQIDMIAYQHLSVFRLLVTLPSFLKDLSRLAAKFISINSQTTNEVIMSV